MRDPRTIFGLALLAIVILLSLKAVDEPFETVHLATSFMTSNKTVPAVQKQQQLNFTKVASIIETRVSPILPVVMHSFLSGLPPDWPFVFWGSTQNIAQLRSSTVIKPHIESGRLNLTVLPSWIDLHDNEFVSRFLSKPWFYNQFQPEAEWLFLFQMDSILCSNSGDSIENWLGYDYVGAPVFWGKSGRGGNGGFSLRKLSTAKLITQLGLTDPEFKRSDWDYKDYSSMAIIQPEDWWFMMSIWHAAERDLIKSRWPEDDDRDQGEFSITMIQASDAGKTLRPFGLHRGSGEGMKSLHPPNYEVDMKRLLAYCPEFAILQADQAGAFA